MKISILTATFNSAKYIKKLIESLNKQDLKKFEWIIIDNISKDKTLKIIRDKFKGECQIICEKDNGIYQALNKGLKIAKYDYYLVLGCDDFLFDDGLDIFLKSLKDKPDAITAQVFIGKKINKVKGSPRILNRQFKYFSAHSVGTIFKKDIHSKIGYYNERYQIASDQEFMMKLAIDYKGYIKEINSVVGIFGTSGKSSTNVFECLSESFNVSIKYDNRYILLFIYFLKLIKNIHIL